MTAMRLLEIFRELPDIALIGTFAEPLSDTQIEFLLPDLDAVEVRADLYPSRDVNYLTEQCRRFGSLPVIFTVRDEAEGGKWSIEDGDDEKLELIEEIAPSVDAVDIEGSSKIVSKVTPILKRLGKDGIISFHDFDGTPPNEELEEKLASAKLPAEDLIIKFGLKATSQADHDRQKKFADNHPNENLIMVPMDEHHPEKRLEIPTLATYVYVTDTPVAPGQLHVTRARKILQKRNTP